MNFNDLLNKLNNFDLKKQPSSSSPKPQPQQSQPSPSPPEKQKQTKPQQKPSSSSSSSSSLPTIYISIPSYRDPECIPTIINMIKNHSNSTSESTTTTKLSINILQQLMLPTSTTNSMRLNFASHSNFSSNANTGLGNFENDSKFDVRTNLLQDYLVADSSNTVVEIDEYPFNILSSSNSNNNNSISITNTTFKANYEKYNYSENIEFHVLTIDSWFAKGPVYARALIEQYLIRPQLNITTTNNNDNKFYLLIDSHMSFLPNWDLSLIDQYNKAKNSVSSNTTTTKVVLSTYPASYNPKSINRDPIINIHTTPPLYLHFHTWQPLKANRHVTLQNKTNGSLSNKCKTIEIKVPLQSSRSFTRFPLKEEPVSTTLWAACFSFSSIDMLFDVPYDINLPYLFTGEEFLMCYRLYCNGYRCFAPGIHILFHLESRNNRSTFWEQWHSLIKPPLGASNVNTNTNKNNRIMSGGGAGNARFILTTPAPKKTPSKIPEKIRFQRSFLEKESYTRLISYFTIGTTNNNNSDNEVDLYNIKTFDEASSKNKYNDDFVEQKSNVDNSIYTKNLKNSFAYENFANYCGISFLSTKVDKRALYALSNEANASHDKYKK